MLFSEEPFAHYIMMFLIHIGIICLLFYVSQNYRYAIFCYRLVLLFTSIVKLHGDKI